MPAKPSVTKLSAGDLTVSVAHLPDGLSLRGVTDQKSGRRFLQSDAPLFTLTARKTDSDETLTVSSDAGWGAVDACVTGKAATFVLADHCKLPGVTVQLCGQMGNDRVEWTVRLHSENPDHTLYACDYPILSFRTCSRTKVFFPYGCGEIYPSMRTFSTRQNYPSYGASMQYLAVYHTGVGRGLYYGLHDPAPAYKQLEYRKEEGNSVAYLKATMPLRDIDRPGNSQTLEGTAVWQLFDGDWYDAALLYRAFFEQHASWMPEKRDGKRTDTPEWLRTNPHWWRKRMLWDESFADELLEADADLGLQSASPVHLYDWFQIPYDTNYPHYFPAKDAFLPGIRKIQAEGMRVMPYINGRLWDTHDRGKEDWMFTSTALPNCTKQRDGKPFLEVYPTSNIELAIMCPSTALWQETVKDLVDKLTNECGVDGVYLDQIGAARAYPCEDRTHSHRPGGGSWWIESYRNLLDHARRTLPEGGFFSTECTSDPYMKDIQAYLSWIWIKNDQVPAFMVIYNDYITVFGRCYDYTSDAAGQDILAAQSLTFGEQMGWIKPEVYKTLEHKDFYRKCVRTREALGSYFYDGRLLRSPVIEDSRRVRTTKIKFEAYGGLLEHTATFSELWERKDGKKLLLLINASPKETTPTLTAALPDGDFAPGGDLQGSLHIEGGKLTATLPPLSVSWITI